MIERFTAYKLLLKENDDLKARIIQLEHKLANQEEVISKRHENTFVMLNKSFEAVQEKLMSVITTSSDRLKEVTISYEEKLENQRKFFSGQIQQERQEKRTILDRFVPEIQSPEYKNYELRNGNQEQPKDEWKQQRFPTPSERIMAAYNAENELWEKRRQQMQEDARKVVEQQKAQQSKVEETV